MENNEAFYAVQQMLEEKKQKGSFKKVSEATEEVEEIDNLLEEDKKLQDDLDRDALSDNIEVYNTTRREGKEVDIDKIKIDSANALERNRMLKNLLKGTTSTFEVTAGQSGYSCKLAPLTNKDSFNILNTSTSQYESLRMTYKTIYDKITSFSCGPMTFDAWLKATTVGDIETLYYGLYCATFLDEGTFRFTCTDPDCRHVTEQTIRNSSLIRVEDFDEMKELSKRISKESTSIEAMKELSLVNKSKHVELSKTRIIAELKIPTLYDLLELYRTLGDKEIDEYNNGDINSLLCIRGILFPSPDGSSYIPTNDKNEILMILNDINIIDAGQLRNSITTLLGKYHVSYKIKSVKCAKCGKETTNIPLDIRSILFTQIYENR